MRVYLTPAELTEMPLGIALTSQLASLGSGVLDKLLARASQRVDSYCKRRIQAPGTTTLSSGALIGAPSISVASTLTLDGLEENAAIIGTGSTQETVLIQPGGVSVTSYTSPYPGTLTLASSLLFTHSSGESVRFVYMEVTEAGGVSNSDRYSETLAMETQEGQIAQAHQPLLGGMIFTRICFLRNYPIIRVFGVEHAYSFINTYIDVGVDLLIIEAREGWYRFSIGQGITPQGLIRTTYTGGYQVVPDDIKLAVSYYLSDTMQQMQNPYGLVELQMGKVRRKWGSAPGKSQSVCQAEEILCGYRRKV